MDDDELAQRIRSLEAERLRPVPAPPGRASTCGSGVDTAVDNVVAVDFRGQPTCGDRTTDQQATRRRLKASDPASAKNGGRR